MIQSLNCILIFSSLKQDSLSNCIICCYHHHCIMLDSLLICIQSICYMYIVHVQSLLLGLCCCTYLWRSLIAASQSMAMPDHLGLTGTERYALRQTRGGGGGGMFKRIIHMVQSSLFRQDVSALATRTFFRTLSFALTTEEALWTTWITLKDPRPF